MRHAAAPAPPLALLQKSFTANRQLPFANRLSLAAYSSPPSPPVFLNQLIIAKPPIPAISGRLPLIISFIDSRTPLRELTKSSLAARLLWYFPITQQTFKIQAISQSFSFESLPASLSELLEVDLRALMTQEWKKMSKTQKDKYHSPAPGSLKAASDMKDQDLGKYAPQIEEEVSTNFSILISVPIHLDYLKEAPPSVIADSRHPVKTESLLASPKLDFRCEQILKIALEEKEGGGSSKEIEKLAKIVKEWDGEEELWEIRILNP